MKPFFLYLITAGAQFRVNAQLVTEYSDLKNRFHILIEKPAGSKIEVVSMAWSTQAVTNRIFIPLIFGVERPHVLLSRCGFFAAENLLVAIVNRYGKSGAKFFVTSTNPHPNVNDFVLLLPASGFAYRGHNMDLAPII